MYYKTSEKLSKKKEFDNVFLKGRSVFSKILGLKIIQNHSGQNRFGIIVSSKVSKKAVERNYIKRQIRQTLREIENNINHGYDLVFIALPPIMVTGPGEIRQDIVQKLKKLRLLNK